MVRERKRPLKVFLCHASGDKSPVRDLYKRLTVEGVDPWLDKEKLLPGQDWRLEIPKAVQEADVVVVCLSNKSITKEGYVQKEIKFALDSAEEKPEGSIFLIPARLEDCSVPERLSRWQWVDLYEESGFIQLLRSLKLRADAVGATVEPTSYVDSDKETERRLDQLYTEGLAAFYTEDWDRACQRFQSILSERPGHKHAAEKLAEAERQRDFANLYEQAADAVRAEDWEMTIKILEELSQRTTDYKDVSQLLKNARKQNQLQELYAEAGKLHAAQKWQAVVKVFEQIALIEPNFPDVNGLLPSAQKEVAEIRRVEELNNQYSHALREMDAKHWHEARRLLELVHKSEIRFLETEKLLKKVENEIAREEQKRKQNDEINTLYEQAHGLLRSKKWRNALEKLEQIRKLDEHFADVDGISDKAQKGLTQEEQEAERQNKLAAMYAEAVRLLKEEKYQDALGKWQEVKTIDPKYPDRQWVQRTAKRKLSGKSQDSTIPEPRLLTQNKKVGWSILLAAIGFGVARLIEQYFGMLFSIPIPPGIGWGLRGVLQGLVVALILGRVEKDWDWKVFLTFGVGGAVIYPITFWALQQQSMLLTSILLSLAPVLSILIISLWLKRSEQWQLYSLIFMGWTLAWVVGQSLASYINPLVQGAPIQWVFCDGLVGGMGLWITIDLLKSKSGALHLGACTQADTAKLLLQAFIGVIILRVIWGPFQSWFHIWEGPLSTFPQFLSLFILGGFFGAVVAFSLKRFIQNWKSYQSMIVIIGWALGFGVPVLALQLRLDFNAVLVTIVGLSMVTAIKLSTPSISPLKMTLIFISLALARIYGSMLGDYLNANVSNGYVSCFADATNVFLGLLATFVFYEYGSERLARLTFVSGVGVAIGYFVGSALTRLLSASPLIEMPLQYALLGFAGCAVFELPSRDWKKILIKGGICAGALALTGFIFALPFISKYLWLQSIVYGAVFGLVIGLSSRKISIATNLMIVGAAIFTITHFYVARLGFSVVMNVIVSGALIGMVIGFGYAYLTKDMVNRELTG